MAAVASATLRGSCCRRISSPLDSPMDLQGRAGAGGRLRTGQTGRQADKQSAGWAGWQATGQHVALLPGKQAILSRQATLCSPPEVLHQLHSIPVVNLDLVHINRRDAQPRPRQQVASIPHLAGRAAGKAGARADRQRSVGGWDEHG